MENMLRRFCEIAGKGECIRPPLHPPFLSLKGA
jgi:hypothetical protein